MHRTIDSKTANTFAFDPEHLKGYAVSGSILDDSRGTSQQAGIQGGAET